MAFAYVYDKLRLYVKSKRGLEFITLCPKEGNQSIADFVHFDKQNKEIRIDKLSSGTSPDYYMTVENNKVKMRTLTEAQSDIGAGAHTHDGDTLQLDGINSDGGAFSFTTTGDVTFNRRINTNTALYITAGTLNSPNRGLNLSATMDNSAGGENIANLFTVTGNGSESQNQRAFKIVLAAGYTGANQNTCIRTENYSVSTGSSISSNGCSGAMGISANAMGASSLNVGNHGFANNAAVNIGVVGLSRDNEAGQTNYGVRGIAGATGGSAKAYGGYFSIDISSTDGSALACDNTSTGNNIFEAKDNSSNVFVVANGGYLLTNQCAPNTNTPSGATAYQLPIYNISGTLLGYIPVYGSTW